MTNGEKYGTAKERADAFEKWCKKRKCSECDLAAYCPVRFLSEESCRTSHYPDKGTVLLWLDLDAEEVKPLPCPFCGGKTLVCENAYTHRWFCACEKKCGYFSQYGDSEHQVIAAHNRVARAAKEKAANDANA